MLKRAVKQADVIFTVSNFSKERIISLLAAKQKIYVTYNGINRALLNYDSTCVKPRFNFDYFFMLVI